MINPPSYGCPRYTGTSVSASMVFGQLTEYLENQPFQDSYKSRVSESRSPSFEQSHERCSCTTMYSI